MLNAVVDESICGYFEKMCAIDCKNRNKPNENMNTLKIWRTKLLGETNIILRYFYLQNKVHWYFHDESLQTDYNQLWVCDVPRKWYCYAIVWTVIFQHFPKENSGSKGMLNYTYNEVFSKMIYIDLKLIKFEKSFNFQIVWIHLLHSLLCAKAQSLFCAFKLAE